MAGGNGARPAAVPAAAGHWLQTVAPNFRHQILNTIVRELSNEVEGRASPHLHAAAAQFEHKVLMESSSKEEYLRAIGRRIDIVKLHLQQKRAGDSRAATAAAMAPPVSSQPQMYMYAGVQQPMAQLQVQPENLAGRTAVRPNAPPNHPLWQNTGGMCIQQQQPYSYPYPQPVMRNQQGLSANQHQLQGYHGNPRAPATMGGGGEVDWREDMFRKITCLKDSYLSELEDLDRTMVIHPKTKEQLESASNEEAQYYKTNVILKNGLGNALWMLQLQKGDLNESIREQFGMYHKGVLGLLQILRGRARSPIEARNVTDPAGGGGGGMVPYAGGTNSQQIQHEQAQTGSSSPPAQNYRGKRQRTQTDGERDDK